MEETRADFQRIIVQVCKAFLGYGNVLRRVEKNRKESWKITNVKKLCKEYYLRTRGKLRKENHFMIGKSPHKRLLINR